MDNGVKGAEGGTALRNIILSLGSPTDKAAKLMKKLGLEVYDASGNMRGTNEIFKDLNKILGTMTEQERTKVLSELFNKVDLKSANALLANSGERFDELSKHIANSQGSAEEMAKTMSGNLKGAMDNFKSALEGLGIAAYEKFSEPLTNAVKFVTDGISWLVQALQSGNLDGILNNIGLALSVIVGYLAAIKGYAIVSGIIAFVKPLFTALTMVKSFSGAMAILNAVFMANPIGIVIGLLGALAGAFVYAWNTSETFRNVVVGTWEAVKEAFSTVINWIKNAFTVDWSNAFGFIGDILNSHLANVKNIFNSVKQIFNGIIEFVKGVFTANWSRAWQGVVNIFGGIMNGLGAVIKAPLNAVIGLVNSAISGLNKISVTIPDFVPVVGGKHFGVNLPKVPYLYNGGIVTQPTFMGGYVAGDSYKGRGNQAEAVIPLDKLENWIKSLANRPVEFYIDGKEMMRTLAPHQSEFDEYSRMTSLAFR